MTLLEVGATNRQDGGQSEHTQIFYHDPYVIWCSVSRFGEMLLYFCAAFAGVWHPGLTIQQSEVLEQVQRQVLRVLLPDSSYSEARHLRTTNPV